MTMSDQSHVHDEESVAIRWDEFRILWDRAGEASSRGRSRTDMAASALWLAALFVVFITWNGAAGKTSVGEQVPYLVSGGLATVSLTVAGSIVFLIGAVSAARTVEPTDNEPPPNNGAPS